MLLSDFDFELPDELIARYPAARRSGSRLLEVSAASGNGLRDRSFTDLPDLLKEGDLLVFNDTQVIKARLFGNKESGGRVEILVERPLGEDRVLAHVRASKSPRPGTRMVLAGGATAAVIARRDDLFELEFSAAVLPFLEEHGEVPLPPYLERPADATDVARYQTVYARHPGAVAAPTAGLHFDDQLLTATLQRGVRHAWLTLHVGAGTFQALRAEHIEENRLHRERVQVAAQCVDEVRKTRAEGGRVIAVGTTAVRSLEAASQQGELQPFDGETELFITPGYQFRSVDALLTNFHLPQSSLLMLVAAFAGRERVLQAYRHAVREEYRFFSYGDAMFLTPERCP